MTKLLPTTHVFSGLRKNHYRLIHIDPPTKFVAGTKSRPQHYKRMTDHEIASLPVEDLMHPDGCWIALWTTSPRLYRPMGSRKRLRPDEIAHAWGARFSARGWLWIKTRGAGDLMHLSNLHRGQGLTTGKNAEDCLLFRAGKAKVKTRKGFEIILSPVRQHSRKPDEIYDQIELLSDGPYCELFARGDGTRRRGWDFWGDELGKFTRGASLFDDAA